jgi:putative mRNA 3-end processing factor
MTRLNFLGAIAEVGRSGILVDTGEEKILLDYGTKIQETPPKFPLPVEEKLNATLLSHCHLDHSGALALLHAKGNHSPIFSIDVTKSLTEMLLSDSIKISREDGVELPFTKHDVARTIESFIPIKYKQPLQLKKTEITFFDAGHIPGSAFHYLDTGEKTILYTGDFNTSDTRLLKKADTNLPHVSTLITETTYADRDHPDRKSQEKQLIEVINDTLAVDGVCIIAGFGVGRLDEILLVLNAYGIDYPVYVDGMAKKAITAINQHKNLLREPNSLDKALEKVEYVSKENMRKKIIKQPCVILTTSGMLNGGPVVGYIKKLYDKIDCSLILTGFQVEGTSGKILLETGKYINEKENLNLDMKMFVKKLDFSSHVGRTELFKFIEKLSPEKVFCIHGDHTEEFSQELKEKGFDAIAPLANNRIFNI